MLIYLKRFVLFFLVLFSVYINAQIETVSVNTKGYGDGPESALNAALTQAIGQVLSLIHI